MGTSKFSSTIDSVFTSIQQQLEFIFEINIKDKKYKEAETFRDKLVFISNKHLKNNRLIILLDSIDQLSKGDYGLYWFFNDLPKGIKIIFSVLNDYENILERLKKVIKENILEIKPFTLSESKEMLYSYLKASNRQLTTRQKKHLINHYKYDRQFLYLLLDDSISKLINYSQLYSSVLLYLII